MQENIMFYLVSVSVLLIWVGVLLHHLILQKVKKKILNARSAEDMGTLRCGTATKRLVLIKKFHKFFIVTLVVVSLNFVITSVLRATLLLREDATNHLMLTQILLRIIRPVSVLILLSGLGAYTITKNALSYFEILLQKCRELGVINDK